MQPRSLQSILSELDSVYQPQIDNLRQRQSAIPGQTTADEQALGAQQQTAFGDILNGARRRGMGFSGIPLQEQARYTSDNYLPALAHLKQQSKDQAMSLEDAILGIQTQKNTQGQSIYEGERNFAEQQRQFNEQMAQTRAAQAAASSINPSNGYGGGQDNTQPAAFGQSGAAEMRLKPNGGGVHEFVNAYGNPISAAQYAQIKKIPFRDLLQVMARSGDKGAQSALGFVGNDYGYDPNKVKDQNSANLYNSLTWGVSHGASPYTQPAAHPQAAATRPMNMISTLPISSLIRR